MAISTAMTTSFKSELFSGAHCFQATVTPTATASSGSANFTSVSSMSGVAVGMSVTGTNVGAGSVVAAITSSTTMTLSVITTGTITGGTLTIAGDVFKMALFASTASGTYGAATTNYSNMTAEEVASGGGYTTGGAALTNVSPTTSGTTAFINFSPNPQWTSATFSTIGCMIYNTADRLGGVTGRACSVHTFGGTQTVSSGTFSVLMPTADNLNAILRIA